jgi:hypothetical protein
MSSSSAVDVSQLSSEGLTSRKQTVQKNEETKDDQPEAKTEFAHSFPMHTHPAPSILSKESTEGLSFRGFGNLGCKLPVLQVRAHYSTRHDIWQLTTCSGELCQGSLGPRWARS